MGNHRKSNGLTQEEFARQVGVERFLDPAERLVAVYRGECHLAVLELLNR